MEYIQIPYQDHNNVGRQYVPDFFVKTQDGNICIIETKGGEYIDDPIKKNALEKKIAEVNLIQKDIKYSSLYVLDNKIHIQLLESTHIKNIVFDITTKDFLYLYDGILEFHDDYYIASHSKSYFYGGGAFWYSAKRDYQNNILELIDLKTNFSNCEDTKLYSWTGQLYDFILETNNLQNCREH